MSKIFTAIILLSLCTVAGAQTSAPADVQAKLSLAENKTVYRMGESIRLVLAFTADREGYTIEYTPDGKDGRADTVVISPEGGFVNWLDEVNEISGWRCVVMTDKVSRTPKTVELILNDKVRFDSPGRYSVSVTTRRVTQSSESESGRETIILSSNPVTFEVQPMSDEDEAKQVKRLSELLDGKPDPRKDQEAAQQLSYLTGDPSTREKVRRFFINDQRVANYYGHLWFGLFMARNRPLVFKLIDNKLADPNTPVTFQVFNAATRLKFLLMHGAREKPSLPPNMVGGSPDPRAIEIRDAYVMELAASLNKRTGDSQTRTAITLLTNLDKTSPSTAVQLREVRGVLVQQFHTLHPYDQEWLLQQYWEQLRDPALVPSLRKLLKSTGVAAKNLHEAALKRITELAPDEVRPYVVAEILDAGSFVDPKILADVKDESLPEVDAPLLDQIRTLASSPQNRDRILLNLKTPLLVRFATDKIYQPLMQVYQERRENLLPEARAGLLAYFAKHNDREAMALIQQEVSELKHGQYPQLLNELTELYYSESISALLKELLESDDPSLASHAGYLIGRHGSSSDEKVLTARLQRWNEQWRDRPAEADAQRQGQIERELIYALVNGKGWKLSEVRVKELKASCLTEMCKQSNRQP